MYHVFESFGERGNSVVGVFDLSDVPGAVARRHGDTQQVASAKHEKLGAVALCLGRNNANLIKPVPSFRLRLNLAVECLDQSCLARIVNATQSVGAERAPRGKR